MSTSVALKGVSSQPTPSLLAVVACSVSAAYAFVVAALASVMRPQQESPAEAALRLRTLAEQYMQTQPSYAADLRAAADRAHGA